MNLLTDNIISLLSSPLQIYSGAVNGLIAEVLAHLKSDVISPRAEVIFQPSEYDQDGNVIESVMIIPVMKVISKYDIEQFSVLGTQTIQQFINLANSDNSCVGVVLHIKNGGGTVINTSETAHTIFQSAKPIISFIEELGASSAFHLAAASNYIFSSGSTTMIGNIGTKSMGIDLTGILEKYGAKTWEIFAKESFDKDLGFNEAMKGNLEKFQNSVLNPYAEIFMSDVRKMRPSVKEEAMHGMVYIGSKAIEMGLCDSIGSLQDAVAKVIELSGQVETPQENETETNNNTMSNILMSVPVAAQGAVQHLGGTVANVDANATTKVTELTAEKAQIQAKVSELETEKTALEARIVALESAKTTAETEKANLSASVTTLTAEIATLKATKPGAAPSNPQSSGTDAESKNSEADADPVIASASAKLDAMTASYGY